MVRVGVKPSCHPIEMYNQFLYCNLCVLFLSLTFYDIEQVKSRLSESSTCDNSIMIQAWPNKSSSEKFSWEAPIRTYKGWYLPFFNCTKNIKRLIFMQVFFHFILSDWRKSVTNRAFLTNRRKQNTHIPTCAENQKFPVQQGTAVLLVGMRSSPSRSLDLENYFILFKKVSSSTVYVIYFCRDCLCVYTFL